jgi:hypothetical protein
MSITSSRRGFVTLALGAAGLATLPGCRRALRWFQNRSVRKTPSTARPVPAAQPALGINLGSADDWTSELPFVDVFRLARPWVSQREGAAYGEGPPLALDEHGWVKSLPEGAWAEALVCGAPVPPAGEWTVLYEGKGRIEMWAPAIAGQRELAPGRIAFDVRPVHDNDGLFVRLRATDPSDPVRNVRVIMPGHLETYERAPFNPHLRERFRGVSAVRFMDMLQTNGSKVARWGERARGEDATWARRGVPYEVLFALAEELGADPWLTVPHLADDAYAGELGALSAKLLPKGRRVYLEYSNEVWNGQFEQARHAAARGAELGLGGGQLEEQLRYYARRSVEVFAAFGKRFGDPSRLVRVLACQSANPYGTEQVLGFEGAGESADALAIAPYLGFNVVPEGDEPSAARVRSMTLEQLFAELETRVLPQVMADVAKQKELADRFGLALIAYEGGQHLTGIFGAENDAAVTKLLVAANRDARMGALYDRYFAAWKAAGGGVFCHYNSVSRYGKWGSWGLLDHDAQDPSTSPKWRAYQRFAAVLGQKLGE